MEDNRGEGEFYLFREEEEGGWWGGGIVVGGNREGCGEWDVN